jgi:hypothetical protein
MSYSSGKQCMLMSSQIDQLPKSPVALTMQRRAQGLLCNLCLSSPWCVIFPEQRRLYELVLGALFASLAEDKAARRIRQLIDRNNRLAVATGNSKNSDGCIPPTMVASLDSTVPQELKMLSSRCLQLAKNTNQAVLELLIWSSTIYRIGSERTYTAIQIFTAWFHEGIDITSCILSGLPHLDQIPHLRTRIVGRIVAELSHQGFFDLSVALRSFIVTGSIRRSPPADQVCQSTKLYLFLGSSVNRYLAHRASYLICPSIY